MNTAKETSQAATAAAPGAAAGLRGVVAAQSSIAMLTASRVFLFIKATIFTI